MKLFRLSKHVTKLHQSVLTHWLYLTFSIYAIFSVPKMNVLGVFAPA